MGFYKLEIGGNFLSLTMVTNFDHELESCESHSSPPLEVSMIILCGYQLSPLNRFLDSLFIEFSKKFTVSFLILNYFPFLKGIECSLW